ncbi:MAG: flagellar FlbD family protein [Lachnospiraceae bacterium]
MIKVTRLNGEIIYLNYLQIQYIESIPETKIKMVNGAYYLVKDQVESILRQVASLVHSCVAFENKLKDNRYIE